MTARADDLRAWMQAVEGVPVRWATGGDDCCAWVAGWAARCGTVLRLPLYDSERTARALIGRAGGLDRLVVPVMQAAGLIETRAPGCGDIGLVDVPEVGPVGCIVMAAGLMPVIVRRAEGGVAIHHARTPWRMWRLP